jgi:hypothetical protein
MNLRTALAVFIVPLFLWSSVSLGGHGVVEVPAGFWEPLDTQTADKGGMYELGGYLGWTLGSLMNPLLWIVGFISARKRAEWEQIVFGCATLNVFCFFVLHEFGSRAVDLQFIPIGKLVLAAGMGGLLAGLICVALRSLIVKSPRVAAGLIQGVKGFDVTGYSHEHFETAMKELDSGECEKGTWAKALVVASGDENRAKSEYIKFRVKDLERNRS